MSTVKFVSTANLAGTFDLCVIGGSCTGVFAALRAARLGLKVALVELSNRFGGVATLGQVGMWHTLFDTAGEQQIIAGLTFETLERLEKRAACTPFREAAPSGIRLNTEELTLILDRMVNENDNIKSFLHTQYIGVEKNDKGSLETVFAATKSGIIAIKASVFIDASGDALLCRDSGISLYQLPAIQPPTATCRLENYHKLQNFILRDCLAKYRDELPDLPPSYHWGMQIPGSELRMLAGTRVLNSNCSNAEELTEAEFTSRRQIYALLEMFRRECPDVAVSLQGLPAAIGIRDGKHIESIRQLKGDELLFGHEHPDAIGNGTYAIDIHGSSDDQIEFYRLNGEYTLYKNMQVIKRERWLPEGEILPYYRFTLSALIPKNNPGNLFAAGRMLDADQKAFGAVRVMVNLNQCGEAAGVAAAITLDKNIDCTTINPQDVREKLADGGSIVL